MSPLWEQQNDLARVNMSSTVFPPPDIDWAHTLTHTHIHTRFLRWGQHTAREEGLFAALRGSCRPLQAGSFLSLTPPFSTGLITPWDSRPGRRAHQHCPLWPALKWRPLPSAGVNLNQVLFFSLLCLTYVHFVVSSKYLCEVKLLFHLTLVNLYWFWQE